MRKFCIIAAAISAICMGGGTAHAAYACISKTPPTSCTGNVALSNMLRFENCTGPYGTAESVEVEGLLSNTSGTQGVIGEPSTNSGAYCWCRIFKIDDIPVLSSWVYTGLSSTILANCSHSGCGLLFELYRNALFSAIKSGL
jgi:hypothetical protein